MWLPRPTNSVTNESYHRGLQQDHQEQPPILDADRLDGRKVPEVFQARKDEHQANDRDTYDDAQTNDRRKANRIPVLSITFEWLWWRNCWLVNASKPV